jgi:ribosomal protein S18 acetylase RimI-like enzyme
VIRSATLRDLDGLVELERRCFAGDLITRRSFRHLLTRANASILVADEGGALAGYALVLFSRGTALARLYSIAVDGAFRGRGLGRTLLAAAEAAALARGCVSMRSEVRLDNRASLALFEANGYRRIDELEDYYEDHMGAFRFERTLAPQLELTQVRVPYYQQTTDFTCGPASLMMAMRALDGSLRLDRRLELRLWREATSIFMAAGHGGCGPFGLALSAHRRGFGAELFVKQRGVFLVDTVRDQDKKEVMRVVEEDFLDRIRELALPLHHRAARFAEVQERFDAGGIPLVLISSWRIYEERFPHWVVITGFEERFIYVHDPFVDAEQGRTVADCINMPIARSEFETMARYGRSGQRAVVVIWPRGVRRPDVTPAPCQPAGESPPSARSRRRS